MASNQNCAELKQPNDEDHDEVLVEEKSSARVLTLNRPNDGGPSSAVLQDAEDMDLSTNILANTEHLGLGKDIIVNADLTLKDALLGDFLYLASPKLHILLKPFDTHKCLIYEDEP